MHQHIKIGKIVATFGVAGQVILVHNLGKKSFFKNVEALFIEESKNSFLPYFVKEIKAKNEEENYVAFDDILTKESAAKLIGKNVWLLQEDFKKLFNKNAPIALLGFTVISNNEVLGTVDEIIEQPHQILLTILYKGKEAYLPMHQESLVSIDHKKNQIHLNLPDGLLEVYA
ncbi:MAG: ribosome maturation factor RimM [Chitinophagaceae bacterium]